VLRVLPIVALSLAVGACMDLPGDLDLERNHPSEDAGQRCGNGLLNNWGDDGEFGESCDDGNTIETDGCTSACQFARCGDGIVWAGEEACDDGNELADDSCIACTLARCGDGMVHADIEECDDGNDADTDACFGCAEARCGDGVLRADLLAGDEGFEECDDGNTDDDDGCSANCFLARCGDGTIGSGEDCDPDAQSLPDCTENCALVPCPAAGCAAVDESLTCVRTATKSGYQNVCLPRSSELPEALEYLYSVCFSSTTQMPIEPLTGCFSDLECSGADYCADAYPERDRGLCEIELPGEADNDPALLESFGWLTQVAGEADWTCRPMGCRADADGPQLNSGPLAEAATCAWMRPSESSGATLPVCTAATYAGNPLPDALQNICVPRTCSAGDGRHGEAFCAVHHGPGATCLGDTCMIAGIPAFLLATPAPWRRGGVERCAESCGRLGAACSAEAHGTPAYLDFTCSLCADDTACPAGLRCVDYDWSSPIRRSFNLCVYPCDNGRCPDGLDCRDGLCLHGCVEDTDCTEDGESCFEGMCRAAVTACLTDEECTAPSHCISNDLASVCAGQTCVTRADCPTHVDCVEGACTGLPCGSTGDCVEGSSCATVEPGFRCLAGPCASDDDCTQAEDCEEGQNCSVNCFFGRCARRDNTEFEACAEGDGLMRGRCLADDLDEPDVVLDDRGQTLAGGAGNSYAASATIGSTEDEDTYLLTVPFAGKLIFWTEGPGFTECQFDDDDPEDDGSSSGCRVSRVVSGNQQVRMTISSAGIQGGIVNRRARYRFRALVLNGTSCGNGQLETQYFEACDGPPGDDENGCNSRCECSSFAVPPLIIDGRFPSEGLVAEVAFGCSQFDLEQPLNSSMNANLEGHRIRIVAEPIENLPDLAEAPLPSIALTVFRRSQGPEGGFRDDSDDGMAMITMAAGENENIIDSVVLTITSPIERRNLRALLRVAIGIPCGGQEADCADGFHCEPILQICVPN
jgi:cysteine-rich repeat protein